MDFLSPVILCQLLLIAKVANSYILVSADVEDFRALAKKIVPDIFGDHLQKAVLYLTQTMTSGNNGDDTVEKNDDANTRHNMEPYFKARNAPDIKGTKINFEELIAKVKNRLEEELKKKNWHSNNSNEENKKRKREKKLNNIQPDTMVDQIIQTNMSTKRKLKRNMKKTVTTTTENDVEQQYSESQPQNISKETKLSETDATSTSKHTSLPRQKVAKNKHKKRNNRFQVATQKELIPFILNNKPEANSSVEKGLEKVENIETIPVVEELSLPDKPFSETFMKNNDSYEDYVTPEKETNIFASNEKAKPLGKNMETRFKITNNVLKNPIKSNVKQNINSNTQNLNRHNIVPQIGKQNLTTTTTEEVYEDITEKTIASAEIEARTENLWFNDLEKNPGLSLQKKEDGKVVSKIATHFLTRQFYSVFTPKYVTEHTIFAEKYNFDEPLPEKDRAREEIKFFGDPLSKVNMKVKLM